MRRVTDVVVEGAVELRMLWTLCRMGLLKDGLVPSEMMALSLPAVDVNGDSFVFKLECLGVQVWAYDAKGKMVSVEEWLSRAENYGGIRKFYVK